ncbi:MAG: hypothetical protein K9H84_07385 [Bacteroidales bacterium]|nr:hypothetical protein [Bacteroidales bacterium]
MIAFIKRNKKPIVIISIVISALFAANNIIKTEEGKFEFVRNEVRTFYKAEFDSCMIDKVVKRKFVGRGFYHCFSVDCDSNTYPILLTENHFKNKTYFKAGSVISKRSDDYHFKIWHEGKIKELETRAVETFNDETEFFLTLVLSFFFIVLLITIFTPSSKL